MVALDLDRVSDKDNQSSSDNADAAVRGITARLRAAYNSALSPATRCSISELFSQAKHTKPLMCFQALHIGTN